MEARKQPLNDAELAEWESGRDLVAEMQAGVDEMLDGGGSARTTVHEVSEDVHNMRMAQGHQASAGAA